MPIYEEIHAQQHAKVGLPFFLRHPVYLYCEINLELNL